METNLFDRMLSTYMTEQTAVTLTLQNKIRVSGKVKAFDSYVVVMEGQKREILYRHAISSLAPLRAGRAETTAARQPAGAVTGRPPAAKKPCRTNPIRCITRRRSPLPQRKRASTTA